MDEHRPRDRGATVLLAGLAAFLLVYLACTPWDLHGGAMVGAPFGRDFVNFWLGGRLALGGSLATLADLPAYSDLVARTFDHDARDTFVFSYPPTLLLPLAVLARLPYGPALVVWTLANLAALAAATRLVARAGGRDGPGPMLAVCLSPAALTMVLYGHFGGLIALALAGIVRTGERRPVVAGLCLAALTFKPQFALVVGLVLVGAGRWRCCLAGAGATTVLFGASVLAFGLDPWRGFLGVTLPEQGRMLADFDIGMLGTTVSPFLAARVLGLPGSVAAAMQVLASAAAVAMAVRALRRSGPPAPAFLALALAAVLALPYANAYDLAVAAPALTPLVLADRDADWTAVARLVTFIAPPLAWHLMQAGVPLLPLAAAATLAGETRLRSGRPTQARLAV